MTVPNTHLAHSQSQGVTLKHDTQHANLWTVTEDQFDPVDLHHKETIFTIGNGYLCSRGAFEEGYPGDSRGTFIHGVFDAARNVNTELVNEPDWLPLTVLLDGERFSLDRGKVEQFQRILDLRCGLLTRTVQWRSPHQKRATIIFERFTSLADSHSLFLRCRVIPEFNGTVEFRAALNGHTDNLGVTHLFWLDQGEEDGTVFLHNRTRESKIETVYAMRVDTTAGLELNRSLWDVENRPSLMVRFEARAGKEIVLDKQVAVYTSRDVPAAEILSTAMTHANSLAGWERSLEQNQKEWEKEWDRTDVLIEGDDAAQQAIRFNLYELLIAAPRHDNRVSIGAKAMSGFGYRGHVFWDTEIYMLPLFIYTAPYIARNLLDYRYLRLDGARAKAASEGREGAQFPWESADAGDEVTPTWIPDPADRRRLVRIWTGDIELHISADIAYGAYQYWQLTGDDDWFIEKGAELVLDTAKFWASRAEWNSEKGHYEYNNVIGPDEYHDHVNNNAFTNRMAQWNLQTALEVLDWLKAQAPDRAEQLTNSLDLSPARMSHWRDVIEKIYFPLHASGLIEQFDGYCNLKPVYMAALEPRDVSTQHLFGIQGSNERQAIKQPDVLMLLYLLRSHFAYEIIQVNYDFYAPRTDVTYGSSLGPAIQAILACELDKIDEAHRLFSLAAGADLHDLRGNAGDGIHGALAGGTWQAIVFGFAGLRVTEKGWTVTPHLPAGWKRIAFHFYYRGQLQTVEVKAK